MGRYRSDGAARVYDVVERWVELGLREDDSLFTPGRAIWAPDVIEEFYERHVRAPKPEGGSFTSNLVEQLAEATAQCWQFAAELVFVHFLIVEPGAVRRDTKLELLTTLLQHAPSGVSVSAEYESVLGDGFVHPGQGFNQMRHAQIGFLAEFVREWKTLPTESRDRAIDDPWEFKRLALAVEPHGGLVMRNALLHLVHPETFERVIVAKAKRQIVKRFAHLVRIEADDDDRQLLDVRAALSDEHGRDLDFYDDALARQWQPDTTPWGRFITWATRLYNEPGFDERERDYKLEVAERIRQALAGVDDRGGGLDELRTAIRSGKNNLIIPIAKARLKDWIDADPTAAVEALRAAGDPESSAEQRVRRFLELLPEEVTSGLHSRARIAGFATFVGAPEELAPYQLTPYRRAYDLAEAAPGEEATDPATVHGHAMAFLDQLLEEAAARGLELRDRLDAQCLIYEIASTEPPERWSDTDRRAFERWRGGSVDEDREAEEDDRGDEVPSAARTRGDLADLSRRLYLGDDFLPHVRRLLNMKPQLIFYGPPGTGKTFVAQRLAEAMAGTDGHVEIVQFHPSYAYEDFVEGYRPNPDTGGFRLVDGPLKRLAKRAAEYADVPHVLIIDELNRGNVAKVFGELYFLLEYRDSNLSLQYSSDPFRLPDNLFIIATMNTADRSIALVDAALRRRFFFVPFMTDEAPVDQLLRSWTADHAPTMTWVADVVDEANRRLADRHAAIGPSHFLRKDGLTEESVRIAWKYSILPYLEEQLFGEPERLQEFALERLRAAVSGPGLEDADAPSDAP